jgi:D-lactate dehydrogenase
MKIAFFDTHSFEKNAFSRVNEKYQFDIIYLEARLSPLTASLAQGSECVCAFVNDCLNLETLIILKESGVKLIALRSAGFNNVDLEAAEQYGFKVVRVPEYSPYAVAEHAVALILSLNRNLHRSYSRVHEGNFSLNGLVGFDLHGKNIGIVGTGKIGSVMSKIMHGFGCHVLAYDLNPKLDLTHDFNVRYVALEELLEKSDIISLHLPLNPQTHHFINDSAISQMKKGVMLINTGRGALIDTTALIKALKSQHIGAAGLDVYEEEEGVFFEDLSNQVIQDDTLARLLTFPNVFLTSHQGFLTREALANIATTTLQNILLFDQGKHLPNQVCREVHVRKAG